MSQKDSGKSKFSGVLSEEGAVATIDNNVPPTVTQDADGTAKQLQLGQNKLEQMMEQQRLADIARAQSNLKAFETFRSQNEKLYQEKELEHLRRNQIQEPLDNALMEIDVLKSKVTRRDDMIMKLRHYISVDLLKVQQNTADENREKVLEMKQVEEERQMVLMDTINELQRISDAHLVQIAKSKRTIEFQRTKYKELFASFEQQEFAHKENLRHIEQDKEIYLGMVDSRENKIEKLMEEKDELEEQIEELEEAASDAKDKLKECKTQNKELEEIKKTLLSEAETLTTEHATMQAELADAKEELIVTQERYSNLRERYDALVVDLDELVGAGYFIPTEDELNRASRYHASANKSRRKSSRSSGSGRSSSSRRHPPQRSTARKGSGRALDSPSSRPGSSSRNGDTFSGDEEEEEEREEEEEDDYDVEDGLDGSVSAVSSDRSSAQQSKKVGAAAGGGGGGAHKKPGNRKSSGAIDTIKSPSGNKPSHTPVRRHSKIIKKSTHTSGQSIVDEAAGEAGVDVEEEEPASPLAGGGGGKKNKNKKPPTKRASTSTIAPKKRKENRSAANATATAVTASAAGSAREGEGEGRKNRDKGGDRDDDHESNDGEDQQVGDEKDHGENEEDNETPMTMNNRYKQKSVAEDKAIEAEIEANRVARIGHTFSAELATLRQTIAEMEETHAIALQKSTIAREGLELGQKILTGEMNRLTGKVQELTAENTNLKSEVKEKDSDLEKLVKGSEYLNKQLEELRQAHDKGKPQKPKTAAEDSRSTHFGARTALKMLQMQKVPTIEQMEEMEEQAIVEKQEAAERRAREAAERERAREAMAQEQQGNGGGAGIDLSEESVLSLQSGASIADAAADATSAPKTKKSHRKKSLIFAEDVQDKGGASKHANSIDGGTLPSESARQFPNVNQQAYTAILQHIQRSQNIPEGDGEEDTSVSTPAAGAGSESAIEEESSEDTVYERRKRVDLAEQGVQCGASVLELLDASTQFPSEEQATGVKSYVDAGTETNVQDCEYPVEYFLETVFRDFIELSREHIPTQHLEELEYDKDMYGTDFMSHQHREQESDPHHSQNQPQQRGLKKNRLARRDMTQPHMRSEETAQFRTKQAVLYLKALNLTRNKHVSYVNRKTVWELANTRMVVRCLDLVMQTLHNLLCPRDVVEDSEYPEILRAMDASEESYYEDDDDIRPSVHLPAAAVATTTGTTNTTTVVAGAFSTTPSAAVLLDFEQQSGLSGSVVEQKSSSLQEDMHPAVSGRRRSTHQQHQQLQQLQQHQQHRQLQVLQPQLQVQPPPPQQQQAPASGVLPGDLERASIGKGSLDAYGELAEITKNWEEHAKTAIINRDLTFPLTATQLVADHTYGIPKGVFAPGEGRRLSRVVRKYMNRSEAARTSIANVDGVLEELAAAQTAAEAFAARVAAIAAAAGASTSASASVGLHQQNQQQQEEEEEEAKRADPGEKAKPLEQQSQQFVYRGHLEKLPDPSILEACEDATEAARGGVYAGSGAGENGSMGKRKSYGDAMLSEERRKMYNERAVAKYYNFGCDAEKNKEYEHNAAASTTADSVDDGMWGVAKDTVVGLVEERPPAVVVGTAVDGREADDVSYQSDRPVVESETFISPSTGGMKIRTKSRHHQPIGVTFDISTAAAGGDKEKKEEQGDDDDWGLTGESISSVDTRDAPNGPASAAAAAAAAAGDDDNDGGGRDVRNKRAHKSQSKPHADMGFITAGLTLLDDAAAAASGAGDSLYPDEDREFVDFTRIPFDPISAENAPPLYTAKKQLVSSVPDRILAYNKAHGRSSGADTSRTKHTSAEGVPTGMNLHTYFSALHAATKQALDPKVHIDKDADPAASAVATLAGGGSHKPKKSLRGLPALHLQQVSTTTGISSWTGVSEDQQEQEQELEHENALEQQRGGGVGAICIPSVVPMLPPSRITSPTFASSILPGSATATAPAPAGGASGNVVGGSYPHHQGRIIKGLASRTSNVTTPSRTSEEYGSNNYYIDTHNNDTFRSRSPSPPTNRLNPLLSPRDAVVRTPSPPAGIGAAVVQRMLTQKPLQPPQLAYLQLQQQQSNSRHGSAAAAAADNGMGTLPLMSQRHSSKSRGDIEKFLAEAAAATIQPDTAGGLPNA